MMTYSFTYDRPSTGLYSIDDGPPRLLRWSVVDESDQVVLSGSLDWQDGVTIYQAEHIDPGQFSAIMQVALTALRECYGLITKEDNRGSLPEPK